MGIGSQTLPEPIRTSNPDSIATAFAGPCSLLLGSGSFIQLNQHLGPVGRRYQEEVDTGAIRAGALRGIDRLHAKLFP